MKHFYKTTVTTKDPEKVNAVIMGNKTYKSMKKPLEKRINYVITHDCVSNSAESESINDNMNSNVHFYNNILNCIMEAQSSENIETIYIIGGASIYQFCFDLNLFDELILSYVHLPKSTSGSVFFPYIDFNKYYINNIGFFIGCIILALEYLAENRIIHRDIKPENLIFKDK